MREIKFRVWIKGLNIWEYDFLPNEGESFFEIFSKKDLVFCQYTGLKDKNDKEIYEGDVVVGSSMMKNDLIDVVDFANGMFMHSKSSFGNEGEDLIDLIDCKVLGNIYENPELLK